MTDAAAVMVKLDEHAAELDALSKALTETERKFEPIEGAYREFVEDFEADCWDRHVEKDEKLPSEALRLAMARRAMPRDVLGQYSALTAKRRRLKTRIGDLKSAVEAQRSLLSALKLEAEASGAGLRRAA